jgi:hypothetical protein
MVASHNPPSSIDRNNTPFTPGHGSHEGANYRRRPRFQPPPPPPGPYKRPPPPRSDSTPLTTSLPSSLTLEHAPVEPHRRHHFTLVAPPLRRSPSSCEPRGEFLTPPFPLPAATGKPEPHPGRSPAASYPRRRVGPTWTGPRPWSTKRGPGPRISHCKINRKS